MSSRHYLQRGFVESAYSDVVVRCFDTSYELHRIVIDQSEYFRSMLSINWGCGVEDDDGRRVLTVLCDDPAISKNGFEIVIKSMYSLEEEVPADQFIAALAAAMFLQYTSFLEKFTTSKAALRKVLTRETCGSILSFAYSRGLDAMVKTCAKYIAWHLCNLTKPSLCAIPSSFLIKYLENETLYTRRGEFDRYTIIRDWLDGNPQFSFNAGSSVARERELEIRHVREKLVGSIQFGSVNNAQAKAIEDDSFETNCSIDMPEMQMYARREQYAESVLSQYKYPWVDPGRRALTAFSSQKQKACMKPVSFRFSFEKRLDKCDRFAAQWCKYLHAKSDVSVDSSENPETILEALPFLRAPVCRFYFAGSLYELSLQMQELEDADGKKLTTKCLEWVVGIAETSSSAKKEQIEFSNNSLVDSSCQDSFLEAMSSIKDCFSLSRFVTVNVTLYERSGGESKTFMGRSSIDGFMPEDTDYEYVTEEGQFERGESLMRSDLLEKYLVFEHQDAANARPPATPREQKMQDIENAGTRLDEDNDPVWTRACFLRGTVMATQHYVLDLR